MQLPQYIAHAGICSRRRAVLLIKAGKISVNGRPITDPAYQLHEKDLVSYENRPIVPEQKVYILLHKPTKVITSCADEKGRTTVLDLVSGAVPGRLYPVGRLDWDTTGLLLLTNDGQLSNRLSHPRYEIEKVYRVMLNKPLTRSFIQQLQRGITLEDGMVRVDKIIVERDRKSALVTLHSGRNRIIRRMFEYGGYTVVSLVRTQFAGLVLGTLAPGQWRHMHKKEREALLKK